MDSKFKSVLFIFKMLMSFFYIAIGFTFILKPGKLVDVIPAQYLPILGVLLIAYGLFRGYRGYIEQKNSK